MAVNLVTVTGNLETLTGATPTVARLWFKLNRPDWNDAGEIFAPEHVEAVANGSGAFSIALQSTDDFENSATYSAILKYIDATDGKAKEFTLSTFALPSGGPYQLVDLLAGGTGGGALLEFQFANRGALVLAISEGLVPIPGFTYFADGLGYLGQSGATAIPDLPGLVPAGDVTPQHFGALGNGVADDGAAINLGLAYLAATGGGNLHLLADTYISSTNHIIGINIGIKGQGREASQLISSNATGNFITLNATHARIEDLYISSSVPRTAGSFVVINWGNTTVKNCRLQNPFIGITCLSPQGGVRISDTIIYNPVVDNGIGILVDQTGVNLLISDVTISLVSYAARYLSSIKINQVGDCSIKGCQLIGAQYGLQIGNELGRGASSVKAVASWFDNCGTAAFHMAGASKLTRSSFIGCWFNTSEGAVGIGGVTYGAYIKPLAGAEFEGVDFTDCEFYDSDYGIYAEGAIVKNLQVQGGRIASQAICGAYFKDITSGSMYGVKSGATGGLPFGPNNIGVELAGNTSNFTLALNELDGNTTSPLVVSTLTGVNNYIHDNRGSGVANRPETLSNKTITKATSGTFFLDDNAATSIFMPDGLGFSMILITDTAGVSMLASVRLAGNVIGHLAKAASWLTATGVLTGTTGTDGFYTLSVDSATSRLYVENRVGGPKSFSYVFLAARS